MESKSLLRPTSHHQKRAESQSLTDRLTRCESRQQPHATVDETVESGSVEESPAHCTTTEGELRQVSEELDACPFSSRLNRLSALNCQSVLNCLPILNYLSCPFTTMEVSFELSVCLELSVCPVMTMEVGFELFAHPELSVTPVMTTEVIPLSAVLPVLGVAI